MASKRHIILTQRDREVLRALDRTPLDARQLLRLSQTFCQPFTQDRLVRRRLQDLAEAGYVSAFSYVVGRALLNYYKLSPTGYQLLYGLDAVLPHRRHFGEVTLSLQHHTRSLADFIVHSFVSAHRNGAQINGFRRENELRLQLGDQMQRPDCAFQVVYGRRRKKRNFVVEIDCGTEPIRSQKQRDSLERKVRFYERYRQATSKSFFVLTVFTKESQRLQRFLEMTNDAMARPHQGQFWACQLSQYTEGNAFCDGNFIDQNGDLQSIIPQHPGQTPRTLSLSTPRPNRLLDMAEVW